ncbi:MAG: hypothetical protein ACYS5V_16020 [Planctomycetota bacterium]|jgi:hypothetical protein
MLAWTLLLAASICPAEDPTPATRPVPRARIEARSPLLLLEDKPPPVIAPTRVERQRPRPVRARIREGTMIGNRIAPLRRGPEGKWWVLPDPRAGTLRLLPGQLLEAIEDIHARNPKARFRLTGEICRYKQDYYLRLVQAAELAPGDKVKPVGPKPATRPAASRPRASRPAVGDPYASAAEVAEELLKGTPDKPIIPPIERADRRGEGGASVAPPGRAVPIGPSRMIVHRLARLTQSACPGWYALSFVSDNTVQDPPMRVLPNLNLEQIEKLSGGGKVAGAVFHVTGDIETYRNTDYILLRNVIRKRNRQRGQAWQGGRSRRCQGASSMQADAATRSRSKGRRYR